MSDDHGYGHDHIAIEGNLPETFQFRLHPEPSLTEIDAIENGSEVVLIAWHQSSPPPTIEGFEMTQEWREYHESRMLSANPEAASYPREDVAYRNLFLFSLPAVSQHADVPSEDEIIDAIVVREEYDVADVRLLVREAVRRARRGMVTNPF